MDPLNMQAITDAIQSLYHAAELTMPTVSSPIAPLGELVQYQNVTCTENTNLSIQSAMNYLLKRGGLSEAWIEPSREPLAGFLYANSRWGSIFVEKSDLVTRRRFSVAHELGHYLLHFQPLLTNATPMDGFMEAIEAFPTSESEGDADALPVGQVMLIGISPDVVRTFGQMEREANQFAAELLMPAAVVCALTALYLPHFREDDLVWRLASELLVSRAAMRWRLRDLDLVVPTRTNLN